MSKKDAHVSNHFTCHAWLQDGRLIVCTDQGEIMLLESSGEYKMLLNCSPGEGFFIEAVQTYSKGFLIAGDNGQIMVCEKTEEPKNPYTNAATWPSFDPKQEKEYPQLLMGIMSSRIRSMCLSSTEDLLVFTTENNQLMKVNVNLERASEDTKYEYLIYPFHSRSVQGLDTCIKKHLIATCSIDKTVRIWNYISKSLEICEVFQDEAYSVAFHPSGFHIIVGFTDKIRMMNVFSKSLKSFKEIPIKSCREIRFSNGGHLFAAVNQHAVHVFNFYTGENPPELIFKGHLGKVRCISWYEDDTGFVSAGWDGNIFSWNLKDNNTPETDPFKHKGTNFSNVVKVADQNVIYAVGTDKTIKEIGEKGQQKLYEAGITISQIALMHGGRVLIAGTADDDRPGAVMVLKLPFNRIFEIQAHSLPIERLRLSFDNNYLFSAGQDGGVVLFDIKDRDPNRLKRDKDVMSVTISEEILTQKSELDEL